MLLLPYIVNTLKTGPTYTIFQYWFLLERNGTYGIEVDSREAAETFAAENGLTVEETVKREIMTVVAETVKLENVLYMRIAKTADLKDFYTWGETPPDTRPMREVWRPFLWSTGESLGIEGGLEEIEIGAGLSVADCMRGIDHASV